MNEFNLIKVPRSLLRLGGMVKKGKIKKRGGKSPSCQSWEVKVNPRAIPKKLIKEDFLVKAGREQGL